ncbi:MAG: hypothetical protein V3U95_08585 [Dehalococcoidia bacterium]|nr:hypothetical protein [Chloroflexota bacterium]
MPMRVGFVQHRMRLLQEELEKIIEMLPQLGVKKAILLNPLYPGTIEPDTSLKLVMIMDDDRPFVRRPDFFYSHLSPAVGVDFFPYTPQELDAIGETDSYLSRAIQQGEIVYDA